MGKRILGLDIQNNGLAAVLVNSGFKESRVEAFTRIEFPEMEGNDNGLPAALDKLIEEMPVSDGICIASMPADHVAFRNLKVPFKQEKKIRQILKFELEPTLPFPIDDVVVDFHALKLDGQGEQTDVIAAACNANGLRNILDLLTARGIHPEIVTVSGFPSALCLGRLGNIPENALVVDVRSGSSTIFVMNSGQLNMVRTLPADRAYDSRTDMLGQNIQRTLYALEEISDKPFHPGHIFVTGPALGENGIVSSLTRLLNVPISRIDLLSDIESRIKEMPAESWKPYQMNNALALALLEVIGIKGLNFRQGPFAIKKRWTEYRKNIITSGILIGALIIVWLSSVSIDYFYKKNQLDKINNQLKQMFQTTFPGVKKIVDPVQQMRVRIDELRKISLLPSDGNNTLAIDILNNISKSIPSNIDAKFTRTVIGEDNVVINGDTDTFNSVDTIKSRLEQVDAFQSVTIVSTTKEDASNRIKFRLKISY
jgi:hypothetical protein